MITLWSYNRKTMSSERPVNFDKTHYKFIRAGEELIIDDTSLQHEQIAQLNHLIELIENLRKTDPSEIDGGMAAILIPTIILLGKSESINAPVFGYEAEAREKTVEIFTIKYPTYQVKKIDF